jgi:hypothetical protein
MYTQLISIFWRIWFHLYYLVSSVLSAYIARNRSFDKVGSLELDARATHDDDDDDQVSSRKTRPHPRRRRRFVYCTGSGPIQKYKY